MWKVQLRVADTLGVVCDINETVADLGQFIDQYFTMHNFNFYFFTVMNFSAHLKNPAHSSIVCRDIRYQDGNYETHIENPSDSSPEKNIPEESPLEAESSPEVAPPLQDHDPVAAADPAAAAGPAAAPSVEPADGPLAAAAAETDLVPSSQSGSGSAPQDSNLETENPETGDSDLQIHVENSHPETGVEAVVEIHTTEEVPNEKASDVTPQVIEEEASMEDPAIVASKFKLRHDAPEFDPSTSEEDAEAKALRMADLRLALKEDPTQESAETEDQVDGGGVEPCLPCHTNGTSADDAAAVSSCSEMKTTPQDPPEVSLVLDDKTGDFKPRNDVEEEDNSCLPKEPIQEVLPKRAGLGRGRGRRRKDSSGSEPGSHSVPSDHDSVDSRASSDPTPPTSMAGYMPPTPDYGMHEGPFASNAEIEQENSLTPKKKIKKKKTRNVDGEF